MPHKANLRRARMILEHCFESLRPYAVGDTQKGIPPNAEALAMSDIAKILATFRVPRVGPTPKVEMNVGDVLMSKDEFYNWETPEVQKLHTEAKEWERLYNKASNERAELLFALRDLQREIHRAVKFDVRKHYSLMVADAMANKLIYKSEIKP